MKNKKEKILSKDKELTAFVRSMSDLISFKLDELYKQEVKTIDDLEREAIENAIKKIWKQHRRNEKSS